MNECTVQKTTAVYQAILSGQMRAEPGCNLNNGNYQANVLIKLAHADLESSITQPMQRHHLNDHPVFPQPLYMVPLYPALGGEVCN